MESSSGLETESLTACNYSGNNLDNKACSLKMINKTTGNVISESTVTDNYIPTREFVITVYFGAINSNITNNITTKYGNETGGIIINGKSSKGLELAIRDAWLAISGNDSTVITVFTNIGR